MMEEVLIDKPCLFSLIFLHSHVTVVFRELVICVYFCAGICKSGVTGVLCSRLTGMHFLLNYSSWIKLKTRLAGKVRTEEKKKKKVSCLHLVLFSHRCKSMLYLFLLSSAGLLSNLRRVRGDTPVSSRLQAPGLPPTAASRITVTSHWNAFTG